MLELMFYLIPEFKCTFNKALHEHRIIYHRGIIRGDFGKKRKPGVMEAWRILVTLEGKAIGQLKKSKAGEIPLQRLKKGRYVYASELTLEDAGRADVWCPTTAYGTWVMKQDDRVMITGNTRAIGRALAALGIGTQFVGEDLSEGEHVADAPVASPSAPDTTPPQVPASGGEPKKASRPKRDDPDSLRETLLAAAAHELFFQTPEGDFRWKPGAKAHCERFCCRNGW